MKQLFSDIQASIYSSDFVSRFRSRSFEHAAFFVLFLSGVAGLIATVAALAVMVPGVWLFFNSDIVADYYPEGLEVQITDGKVSTNQENPYVLPVSYFSDELLEEGDAVNFLTIDTTVVDPLAALESYDTMILVSSDRVVAQKSDGEIRVFSLAEVQDLTISEESTQALMKTIMPWLIAATIMLTLLIPGIVIFFVFVYNLLILLGLAVPVWILGKLQKLNFSYKESYMLAAYALTLPVLFSLINSTFFSFEAPVFLLAFIAVVVVNIRSKKAPTVGE